MNLASPAAEVALHKALPRIRAMSRMLAKRRFSVDPDDLIQWASIGFVKGYDQCKPELGRSPTSYGMYRAEKEALSALRYDREWWHHKSNCQELAAGWATTRSCPDIALRIDMARSEDWEPFMGWPREEVVDWSDWQQSNNRLFQRGW